MGAVFLVAKFRIDVMHSDDPRDNYSLFHNQEFFRVGGSEFYKLYMRREAGPTRVPIEKAEWAEAEKQSGELKPVTDSDFGDGALIDLRERESV